MKGDEDKRLIIPKDAFEEEASEGLGRLNKNDAEEDLRDLEGRLAKQLHDLDRGTARRLRKPIRIWIPAAAAVIIILIASTFYIGLFRDKQPVVPETAMVNDTKKDTVLIAMAEPITKDEEEAEMLDEVQAEAKVEYDDKLGNKMIIVILGAGVQADEVIVQAVPAKTKVAEGIPATRAETRAAKKVAVADREMEYKTVGPDHAPHPAGGIDELNTWISSNIRYPGDAVSRTRQLVTVAFRVMADSTIYDLRVERTPGALFTEEAFRLLGEGPHWVPAVRNGLVTEETVRVSIVFK